MKLIDLLPADTLKRLNVQRTQTPAPPRVHRVAKGTFGQSLTVRTAEWSSRTIDVPRPVGSSTFRAVQVARTYGVKSWV